MQCHGGGLDRVEAPGPDRAHGLMDGQGTLVLHHQVRTRRKGAPLVAPQDLQGHLADEPCGHRTQAIR
jgi:hypothetical protein